MNAATWRVGLLCALLAPLSPAHAATLEEAVESMQSGKTEQAERELNEIARDSTPGHEKDRALAYFYLGTIKQLAAKDGSGSVDKAALQAAEHYYTSAVAIDRQMGSALNNLARVQLDLDKNLKAAMENINRALALEDGREAFYQATRADIAARTGDVKSASEAATRTVILAPQDEVRRQRYIAVALKADPGSLVGAVDALLAKGEPIAAQSVIFDGLAVDAAPRVELIERLADALAAQSYDPRRFTEMPAGVALRKFAKDATLGAAASELLALHAVPQPLRKEISWWSQRNRALRFARLASSLAGWYRYSAKADERTFATPFAELALELSGDNVDPRAVLDLASIYASTGQRDKIKAMSDRYVRDLFQAKGSAYEDLRRTGDYRKVYDLHMALGAIYGYLEKWESGTDWGPASAIFQLEHARSTAKAFNDRQPIGSNDRIIVPVEAINLLAAAYDRTGQPDKSVQLRIDEANLRLASPNPKLAYEVVTLPDRKPVDVSRANPTLRADWEKMEAKVAELPRKGGGTF